MVQIPQVRTPCQTWLSGDAQPDSPPAIDRSDEAAFFSHSVCSVTRGEVSLTLTAAETPPRKSRRANANEVAPSVARSRSCAITRLSRPSPGSSPRPGRSSQWTSRRGRPSDCRSSTSPTRPSHARASESTSSRPQSLASGAFLPPSCRLPPRKRQRQFLPFCVHAPLRPSGRRGTSLSSTSHPHRASWQQASPALCRECSI